MELPTHVQNVLYNAALTEQETADNLLLASKIRCAPHSLYRPRVYIDGDKWCALYGENLQDGVAGFGESLAEAMEDFDKNWVKKLG